MRRLTLNEMQTYARYAEIMALNNLIRCPISGTLQIAQVMASIECRTQRYRTRFNLPTPKV